MKLKQKQFLKGSREFEIDGDTLYVHIKSFLKEEKLTVDLSTLNPEPVINGSEMIFYSDYKGRPLLSLLINNPNEESFNRFINALKQKITGDDDPIAELETELSESVREEALSRNMYEEPPEFSEPGEDDDKIIFQVINVARVQEDITALKTYLDENEIKAMLDAMEVIMTDPESEAAFEQLLDTFNNLGINQGAVLTYAPYLKVIVSQTVRF